jgi:hypothetical protein
MRRMQLQVTSLVHEARDTLSVELRAADSVLSEAQRESNRSMLICCYGSKSERILIDL